MRGHRETVSPAGTEAGEDLRPEFTAEELTREILRDLGDLEPPREEEGWRTIAQMLKLAGGLSEVQLQRRLKKKVNSGEYERVDYKGRAYFRKKVDERAN